jgi:hypothetical protein
MSSPAQTQQPQQTQGKVVEVEAAEEGPKVKPKRVLTESQLEALKLGRAKLAEKRRLLAEEKGKEQVQEQEKEQEQEKVQEQENNPQQATEEQPQVLEEEPIDDDDYPSSYCLIV